jgi:hypothetical protein
MGGNAGVNAATSNDTGSAGGGHTREDSVGRDPEELFCLKWNDYQENVVSTLSELRAEEDFFDVTLACDGEQVRAHKLVLSCCSLFFRRYSLSRFWPYIIIDIRKKFGNNIIYNTITHDL